MLCPKCKGKAVVVDSRKHKTGDVYRRRECAACGFRFSTLECFVNLNQYTAMEQRRRNHEDT